MAMLPSKSRVTMWETALTSALIVYIGGLIFFALALWFRAV